MCACFSDRASVARPVAAGEAAGLCHLQLHSIAVSKHIVPAGPRYQHMLPPLCTPVLHVCGFGVFPRDKDK